ncbi:MAG: HAMP domain-containing sensor histidine kinase [Planctomycetota bacterium]
MLVDAAANRSARLEEHGGLSEGLRVEWEKLAGLVENANAIVIATDEEGVIRIANAHLAHVSRRPSAAITGRRIEETGLFDEAGLAKFVELAKAAQRGEGCASTQVPIRMGETERLFVSWTATVIDAKDARGILFWGAGPAEAPAAPDRLPARSREIAEVASVISHDLRAPLISIDGFAQNLLKRYGDTLDDRAKRYVQRIREGVKRLNELIDSVMDLARVDRREARRSVMKLGEILEDVMADFAGPIESSGARVTVAQDLPSIRGDAVRVYQVFANLLSNALKYSMEGRTPVVDISWRRQDEGVEVSVKDNGAGIAKEELDGIFGMFQRAATAKGEGMGVGLAVVKTILDECGGKIRVESTPGEGSMFVVTLPAADEDTAGTGGRAS